ncbi:hypothetical protein NEOLEDRAFT_1136346 [Neolentinus lepideus HHB14362 ss-1]|uniref:RRM domain-containing protein n=1 Tax=Neolentinus lepideus HHB14362 ss-1 TaxID=1314782 RepID=A0A165RB47_9AGAM|nr:hypothetical protein NEOLEDRAFT_1136346 [Neolentinus lepideus HHB14362 ss-1]
MASLLERISLPDGVGPVRAKNTNRASPYNRNVRPPKGNPDEPWQHDLFDNPNADKRSLSARLSTGSVQPPKMNFGMADKALKDALGVERSNSAGDISIKGASMRGNVVQVTGLVKGTTAADVEAIFKRCGAITKSTVVQTPSPNGDVTVRLTYKNAQDAQAAVKKFNGQQADGKTLHVKIVGGVNATLGGRLGLAVVDGSVDVLMDTDSGANSGSKMRSDSIIASDSRATVLIAPPGADPREYAQSQGSGRGRGGRGRGGRRRGGGRGGAAAMDVD